MFGFSRFKKFTINEEHQKILNKSRTQKAQADKELAESITIKNFFEVVHERNHFSEEFRKAMGES